MNILGKMFGGSKPPPLAGLDVGSATLKVAQVRVQGPGKADLVNLNVSPTPVDVVKNGVISDAQVLGEAIAELLAASNIPPTTKIVSSVTGPQVVIRPITMARVTDRELSKAIVYEAEKYLPYKVAEAQVTGIRMRDLDGQNMETLLIAAPLDMIERAKQAIKVSGCQPEAIDLEPIVLRRALKMCAPDKLQQQVVLLNLGASSSSINILRQGVLCHNRTLQIAGNSITQAIATGLNLPFDQAETVKIDRAAILSDNVNAPPAARTLSNAVKPVLSRMVTEIKRSFDYFNSHYARENLDVMLLAGGTARFRHLAPFLQHELKLPCAVVDPFANFTIGKGLSQENLDAAGPAVMAALGLALR